MSTIPTLNSAYGFTQPLLDQAQPPIIAPRAPLPTDKAQLGSIWVDKPAGQAFVLTAITNNLSNWEGLAGAVSLPSLTVNPGPISLTGVTTINTTGAASTTIGNPSSNINLNGFVNANDGMSVLDGVTLKGGTAIENGTADNTTIGTGGTGVVFIGNITGGTVFTGPLTANPGPISLTGTTTINTTGTANTTIGAAATGSGNVGIAGTDISLVANTDLSLFATANLSIEGATFINFSTSSNTLIGNTGDTSLFGTLITIGGSANTGTININGAPININPSPGIGATVIGNTTGNTSVTGTLTTSNTINVSAGGMVVNGTTAINVGTAQNTGIGTSGTGVVALGNTTGGTAVTGNLSVASGNISITTPTNGLLLPGPVRIISGAGTPANGLAIETGDLYINTTATTTTTRLFIATGAGAWTSFTALA